MTTVCPSSSRGNFYSRPCGRGDAPPSTPKPAHTPFLLTPLREGRPCARFFMSSERMISTHAPAGGATLKNNTEKLEDTFLLTPLREGRLFNLC